MRPLLVGRPEGGTYALSNWLVLDSAVGQAFLQAETGQSEVKDQVFVLGLVADVGIEYVSDSWGIFFEEWVFEIPAGLFDEVD